MSNVLTPTGRTTTIAISRPSTSQAWREARPVIEKLHGFAKLTPAAPKHIMTKGVGDTGHRGRVNGGIEAELELEGDLSLNGVRSLLQLFFSDVAALTEVEAGICYKKVFELPLTATAVFTICTYDGVGRLQEIPSALITSLSIEAKPHDKWVWKAKGHGDRLMLDGQCFNTIYDVLAATEGGIVSPAGALLDSFYEVYATSDASMDANIGPDVHVGMTRIRRSDGVAFDSGDELPWSDFKLSMDLKANAIMTNRRSKAFPTIADIPDVKYDLTVPTESGNVDEQGVWAGLVDDAFLEGANAGTVPQLPFDYKIYIAIVGPLCDGTASLNPHKIIIESPRLAGKCTNPTAASIGLEPIKIELVGMKALEAVEGIEGVEPIYLTYQASAPTVAAGTPWGTPVIVAQKNVGDINATFNNCENGEKAFLYSRDARTGRNVLLATDNLVAGGLAVFNGLTLGEDQFLTCKVGIGEEKSAASTGSYVIRHRPVIEAVVDNLDTDVSGTINTADNGATVYLYHLTTLLGSAVVAAGAWNVAGLSLTLGWVLTAYCGSGNSRSLISDPVTVT